MKALLLYLGFTFETTRGQLYRVVQMPNVLQLCLGAFSGSELYSL